MAQQPVVKEDRSIGELFSELATETSTLIRQEVALAQAEMTQKATKIGKNVGFLVVGGAIAYAALLAIVAAVIVGLAHFIPLWLSALIVGVVLAVAAGVFISLALQNLKETSSQ
ncbi:MAG: phage holin family protein, partial [Pyrinomonadaceae bacterium]